MRTISSDERRLGGLRGAAGPAWGSFLRAHAELVAAMDTELERAHGMPITTYDVLRQLALAPDGRLRMAELADRVMLSRPGLTGVVKRLEAAGHVERVPSEEDGRGLYAHITRRGVDALHAAHATHVRSIRERFAQRFTEEELQTLAALLGRLASTPPR